MREVLLWNWFVKLILGHLVMPALCNLNAQSSVEGVQLHGAKQCLLPKKRPMFSLLLAY